MTEEVDIMKGAFGTLLTRNNKQVKDDRANTIIEDAELEYKREIENVERDIKRLSRERDKALDLSPGNTYSLRLEDFNGADFVKKDLAVGLQMRELEIKLEVLKARYQYLFTPQEAQVASK